MRGRTTLLAIYFFFYALNLVCKNNTDTQAHNYLLYLWGTYNQIRNNNEIAQQCFETILANDGPIYVYLSYLQHLFDNKNYKDIVDCIPKIGSHLDNDVNVQLLLIKSFEATSQYSLADKKIAAALPKFSTHPEICYAATISYMRNNKPAESLKVINNFLENTAEKPMHFIFYFLKAQLYLNIQKYEEAQHNIEKCLALNPNFEQGWLLSGLLNELKGDASTAIDNYKNVLHLVGHNKNVEAQILQLLIKQKYAQSSTGYQQKINAALLAYQEKNFDKALGLVEQCLRSNPAQQSAKLLKIDILCAQGKPEQALEIIYNFIQQSAGQEQELWFRSLHLLHQNGVEQNKIINLLQQVEHDNPTNIPCLLYLADLYLKRHDTEATFYLKKLLTLVDNAELQAKLFYQLAIIYFENNNFKELSEIINKGLMTQTNFPPLMNISAYYFATKGKNLKLAQELISKVLRKDKNNPHYLDTQALIWCKAGKNAEALKLLANLTHKAPNDFFIHKHLSKAYYKQGNRAKALNILLKAQNLNCSSHEKSKCLQTLNRLTTTTSMK